MLNEHQIQMLPERIYQRLNAINTDYLVSVGEVLKEIGELRPTDVHQLQQMYNYGARVDKITKRLAEYSEKNIEEIYDIFDIVAKENYKFAKPFYKARLMDYIPYEENVALQRTVKAMAKQTVGECTNLSQHTVFSIFSKDGKSIAPYFAANKDKVATSLSDTYTKVVDYAVTQVNLGMESYSKAVKDIIKSMSSSGIRTVDYATGYSRRLDTAVRQNVLWAAKECNQQIANQVGEEFGANGREVDYHMYPRPSHADMGGRQFALGKARTVNGVFYPSFEEKAAPLLAEYGCLHFSFPIILGVSQPAYSEAELEDFKEADNATFEFEGKKYTMYQGTQLQRQVETAIRNQRDILTMAKAAGDGEEELIARTKIRQLTDKYAQLSEVSGLPTQMERTKLAVSAKTVDKSSKNVIMKIEGQRGINFDMTTKEKHTASGHRRTPHYHLTEEDINFVKSEIKAINASVDDFVFNSSVTRGTCFLASDNKVYIKGNVFPDEYSEHPRDRLSVRAVLAHEYYGHRPYRMQYLLEDADTSPDAINRIASRAWADEFRASYMAVKKAPNLSSEDKILLIRDALTRAEEAGISIKYNSFIRRVLYD